MVVKILNVGKELLKNRGWYRVKAGALLAPFLHFFEKNINSDWVLSLSASFWEKAVIIIENAERDH